MDFFPKCFLGFLQVDPLHHDLVNFRASGGGGGDQSAVFFVAKHPKVDGRTISMFLYEHVVNYVDFGEVVVVKSAVKGVLF